MIANQTDRVVTVIGRGHSGTRAMSHTLSASGVFMGDSLNESGDLVPADDLYEACLVFAKQVKHLGGLQWDFSASFTAPIDPAFTRLVESYLSSVLESTEPIKGWKLPETTLILPWIARMYPEIHYIYWVRDPRDCVLGEHLTDDLDRFGILHEPTDDVMLRRAISWQYQFEIMKATPCPTHRLKVCFEDFVLDQATTLNRLESFLGFPLATIPVRPDSVRRWTRSQSALETSVGALFTEGALSERTWRQLK